MAKVLTIKNHAIIPLVSWLGNQKLHGSESRNRTRFMKLLSDRIDEYEKTRLELCNKHAAKDKDGKALGVDRDGKETTDQTKMVSFKFTDMKAFEMEFEEYVLEDFIIDITPSNKEIIDSVKKLVLNTQVEFSGADAGRYDYWCEVFEGIKEA